jgi:hypothetical protein
MAVFIAAAARLVHITELPHVSAVMPSSRAASAAVHGASTGIFAACESIVFRVACRSSSADPTQFAAIAKQKKKRKREKEREREREVEIVASKLAPRIPRGGIVP